MVTRAGHEPLKTLILVPFHSVTITWITLGTVQPPLYLDQPKPRRSQEDTQCESSKDTNFMEIGTVAVAVNHLGRKRS